MYRNYFTNRFITLLVDYPDRFNPDVFHHEVRKIDTILWTDNRISDYKFEDGQYQMTNLDYFPTVNSFIVERARKETGWVCLDRNSGHVLGRFSSFDDALEFGKMKEAKQQEKENHFKNHLSF